VYELEPLPGSEARLLGEGVSPLLRQYADVAELLHVVEAREASHHLLGAEPLQGLKVKVPKALVPLPRLVVLTGSEAEGLCNLHIKDVESTRASSYLDKEAVLAILGPQDTVSNRNAQTLFLQLSQADDRVPQLGDVVESGEHPVLTRLGGEDDGANALDLHAGGVPKLDGAFDAGVKLGEELPPAGHVMGGAGVEDPPINLVVAGAVAEGGTSPRLVEVEEGRRGRCRWR